MGQYQQRINNTADNYYRWPGSGSWNQGIHLGNTTWGGHNAFLRFRNVDIAQGTTITSAYITLSRWYTGTLAIKNRIRGVDEDNTAVLTSDATGRATTTAYADWNPSSSWTGDVEQTSVDISSVIQEIIDRGGWSSGNSLALRFDDNGGTAGNYGPFTSYTSAGSVYPRLTINYSGASPSASISPSSSVSLSPSSSQSPSSSFSPSPSPPAPADERFGFKLSKPGVDVQVATSPNDFYLHSMFPLLKVHSFGTFSFAINSGSKTITHNLGYKPFVLVFSQLVDYNYSTMALSVSSEYYQHDWAIQGASKEWWGRTEIFDNSIDIIVGQTDAFSPVTQVAGFYYIFKDETQ